MNEAIAKMSQPSRKTFHRLCALVEPFYQRISHVTLLVPHTQVERSKGDGDCCRESIKILRCDWSISQAVIR